MPSWTQIRQFLCLTVVPVLAGAAANWLMVHLHFLAAFHLTASSVGGELTQLGVFGVTLGITWLSTHNILGGFYTPAAITARNAR
jgi:hypothetical protein